ncbi:uncharacterized protein CMC5_068790 [Chondromyces crocatus]|uniref:HEAT repeat domain-containing protein n=2 Tax=Chondromyces crocatus TaxID=52 RepID=A0A0K1EPS9_CHOCO|nr:uncharacterized protein CMC5_068790 [Chondromyces crocatus]
MALLAALASIIAPAEAQAQVQATSGESSTHAHGSGASLRANVGVAVAQSLLSSSDPPTRLRGITRLGALGTPEAIDQLLEALEQGSSLGRDPRARLEAVRVLAAHTQRDPVRQLLTRELNEGAGAPGRGAASPLSELIRETAALALSRAGDKRSISVLTSAIVQGGAPGAAAERALRAHPPSSIDLIVGNKKLPPLELTRFLGDLGDLRAVERLRRGLAGADVAAQLASGLALAKLGDEVALEPARGWLRKSEPRTLSVAAEILVHLGAREAPGAVGALLRGETTHLEGLRLAEMLPSPSLAPLLVQVLPGLPEEERPRAVTVLGRTGGPAAIKALRALLVQSPLASAAAFALAGMPGEPAKTTLATLLAEANQGNDRAYRRLLLRASILRALLLNDPPAGLEEHLRPMLAPSASPADRAVAAFGLSAMGSSVLAEMARACSSSGASARSSDGPSSSARSRPRVDRACDPPVLQAAARGALARGATALEPLGALLEELTTAGISAQHPTEDLDEPPTRVTLTAGLALLNAPDGGAVPTSQLSAWAEAGGALAPLAARALASRDDKVVRRTLDRLLEGSDPVVRAHVALGLGRAPEPDSISLLTTAYRFEEDPYVRRALIRGISRRTEAQRHATLVLAHDLDPDPSVRSLARAALEGRPLDHPASPLATGVLWITVVPNDPGATTQISERAGRVVRPDGLALPVATDPDGTLLVPGVPPGPGAVTLASAVASGEPKTR